MDQRIPLLRSIEQHFPPISVVHIPRPRWRDSGLKRVVRVQRHRYRHEGFRERVEEVSVVVIADVGPIEMSEMVLLADVGEKRTSKSSRRGPHRAPLVGSQIDSR